MNIKKTFCILPSEVGLRVDVVLTKRLNYSRTIIAQWLKTKKILLNNTFISPKKKVKLGDIIEVSVSIETSNEAKEDNGILTVLFEDSDIIVINKPSGLVVHPGAGIKEGTLLNRLYYHYPETKILPRGGIVHRLDKDTTGLMVIAKNLTSHQILVKMFTERQINKIYRAIVIGKLITGGKIEANINRNPNNRTLKQVCNNGGLYALTYYKIIKNYRNFTELQIKIETGRTHQIRVHLSHLGFPIIGDQAYNHRTISPKVGQVIIDNLPIRQLLHAEQLNFLHPTKKITMEFTAPLPKDFIDFKTLLEQNNL